VNRTLNLNLNLNTNREARTQKREQDARPLPSNAPPRLYSDLAAWWPLLSPPSHYVEEAADLLPTLVAATDSPRTLLELGSGGGSLAYHFKRHFQLTLSDCSPEMLAISQEVNPECEHVEGDMRTLNLGRQFDLVFIHDAIMYLTDAASVRAALAAASRHCRPGGGLVLVPDCVRETFEPATESGGEDGPDGRGLRYLEWDHDPDPSDDTFVTTYAFLLREPNGEMRVEMDQHQVGVFSRGSWLRWMGEAGFVATARPDKWGRDIFAGTKR
jgi:predicted O-methyltransferase YrrM